MRVALFGGSFDPIHRGHVEPVVLAREQLGIDSVIFLPTARPPHKPSRSFAPPHRRFAMVELALLDRGGCFVSAHELTPGRSAYTIDTVEYFAGRFPGSEVFLLLGADSLATFYTWKRWQDIAETVRLVVLSRPGWDEDRLPEEAPLELHELARSERVLRVENEAVDVSSTAIRECLARGEEPHPGELSDLVLRYIHKYALYR